MLIMYKYYFKEAYKIIYYLNYLQNQQQTVNVLYIIKISVNQLNLLKNKIIISFFPYIVMAYNIYVFLYIFYIYKKLNFKRNEKNNTFFTSLVKIKKK